MQVFITALFIMAKNWEQLCPSTDEWINDHSTSILWTTHYPAIKNMMTHTIQMDVKCIMLSGRSHIQKATYCRIPFI